MGGVPLWKNQFCLLDSADLVITVGYDPVEYWPPEWNANKARRIIHIDVLPAALEDPLPFVLTDSGD
jgi:hypothetical protein